MSDSFPLSNIHATKGNAVHPDETSNLNICSQRPPHFFFFLNHQEVPAKLSRCYSGKINSNRLFIQDICLRKPRQS